MAKYEVDVVVTVGLQRTVVVEADSEFSARQLAAKQVQDAVKQTDHNGTIVEEEYHFLDENNESVATIMVPSNRIAGVITGMCPRKLVEG